MNPDTQTVVMAFVLTLLLLKAAVNLLLARSRWR